MAIDIGRIAYQTYSSKLNEDNFHEPALWEELGKEEQDAWRAAAVAVLKYIDESRKQMEENPELVG